MLKKIILLIAAALAVCSTNAQTSVGEWNVFPMFDGSATTLIDAKTKVYYVSLNRLYSYDKESNETYSYSTQNKLSDTNITSAYYNADGQYLLVAYETGNIDIVYDNGRVVNLPDIKNASLMTQKTINDVDFYDGKVYIATVFGIVIYDDTKWQVVESGIYNKSIDFIAVSHDQILIYPADSYSIYRAPISGRHNTFEKFKYWFGSYLLSFDAVGDNLVYTYGNDQTAVIQKIDWDKFDRSIIMTGIKPTTMSVGADGIIHIVTETQLIRVDDLGNTIDKIDLPDALKTQMIAFEKDFSSVWGLDANGLANYDLTSDPVTVLADKAKPDAITVPEVAYMRISEDGKRTYLSNIGSTGFKSCGAINYDGTWIAQRTNYIENGVPHDISLHDASADATTSINYQKNLNSKDMFGGVGRFAVDPDNPDRYYIANTIEGVYVIENGVELVKFTDKNAPLDGQAWSTTPRPFDVNIDPDGNLWVGQWALKQYATLSPYAVLPKSKLKGDLTQVTKDDWAMSKHLGQDRAGNVGCGWKDMGSLFCKKSNMMFNWNGSYQSYIVAYDTKGTYANTSDDVIYAMTNLTDQDGKTFTPERWVCAVEDQRGRVWFGSTSGVIEITNPAKATDPTMHINRIKVPRNDGTNYADYLLDAEQINDIAVDGTNRKWIATENAGVYLVSENGDKILEHFTTDNSLLPSNTVLSVICDPNSNLVYFGLKTGLVSYSSTASPAATDYSEIYAYPNPVRPDYTGVITVTGLMEDSLVKIADAAGNVFAQGRSNGGMFVWDGCDASGSRVHSGVYYVFASQNATGSNSGAVTKILIVN